MILGIPQGLLYYRYKDFIDTFTARLPVKVIYSGATNHQILDAGIRCCVDEACLPIKVFHGHVAALCGKCDSIMIPRIMRCEYGQAYCPKLAGLPDMIASSFPKEEKFCFTRPMDLRNSKQLDRVMAKEFGQLGIDLKQIENAKKAGEESYFSMKRGKWEKGYRKRVFLAGHPYNIYDSFINKNLIEKLHKMDIGVITEEAVPRTQMDYNRPHFLKKPMWRFFVSNYSAVEFLKEKQVIDGMIYLSSFSCGIDPIIIDIIRGFVAEELPILVLKLDEQTGEAGMDTRLEAFQEVMEK